MANVKSLEDVIQEMIDDIENVAEEAAIMIQHKMEEDFNKKAKTVVDEYYEYKNGDYTKYGRLHKLYDTYKVTSKRTKRKGTHTITATLNFEDYYMDALQGNHFSNSRKHRDGNGNPITTGTWESGGPVDADYIFDNFIAGKHPWRWSKLDEVWRYKTDKPSPHKKLRQYEKEYGEKYLEDYFSETIASLLGAYIR